MKTYIVRYTQLVHYEVALSASSKLEAETKAKFGAGRLLELKVLEHQVMDAQEAA